MIQKKIGVVLVLILLLEPIMASHTFGVLINFSGEWKNGVTLYSDIIRINNGTFFGKNAYPIRMGRLRYLCRNSNGLSTNALLHNNFQYELNGDGNYQTIFPKPNLIKVFNTSVRFRVNIPQNCTPIYNINKSVVIIEKK
ncbi:MAG: hypothetical protein AABW90_00520 [Nanoarchaeota archaeon]